MTHSRTIDKSVTHEGDAGLAQAGERRRAFHWIGGTWEETRDFPDEVDQLPCPMARLQLKGKDSRVGKPPGLFGRYVRDPIEVGGTTTLVHRTLHEKSGGNGEFRCRR